MRAISVSEYGASPAITELPRPRPGPGQVLIAIQAAGMNPMDVQIADSGWKDRNARDVPDGLAPIWRAPWKKPGPARSGSRRGMRYSASC